MRELICACAVVVTFASPALAGPEEDATQIVARWAAAFNASDLEAILALYAPDAVFLGTGSRTVVLDPAEIRQYFERALLTDRPRGAKLLSQTTRVLSDNSVVVVGLDETTAVRDGKPLRSAGRVTFVVSKRDGGEWKIIHFHRSSVPAGRTN